MNAHTHDHPELTRNQALVLDVLSHAKLPLSAYAILDSLRDEGLRAPAQIYRALDTLLAYRQVHKIESLNAFVACNHSHCDRKAEAAFAICEGCGSVTEFADDALTKSIAKAAQSDGFTIQTSAIELRGMCSDCSNQ
ncbi:MAG: Fur family transcriptional regulator [Alphaproteobacteria bacterium]